VSQIKQFQTLIQDFYKENKREFPWRETSDPYKILVSEIMLQQTQTSRVIHKYVEFLKAFPDINTLAEAKQFEVLKAWQGLGYNRRALYLKKSAFEIVKLGKFPDTQKELVKLPGIGVNTAGAILAFAFNIPAVFIETNIRRVFIHEFFKDQNEVHDKDIKVLLEKTLDRKNPREFYYALMDYGVYLGKTIENPNIQSRHYAKQSKFEGSLRQTRGTILKLLLDGPIVLTTLKKEFSDNQQFKKAILQLIKEGFIEKKSSMIFLKS
jgi:A/G-specific adenine glycosylase